MFISIAIKNLTFNLITIHFYSRNSFQKTADENLIIIESATWNLIKDTEIKQSNNKKVGVMFSDNLLTYLLNWP